MGVVFEMCYCINNKAIVPNSKSMIENDINNLYDNKINEVSNNLVEEKNKKKIINNIGVINVEQNNDAETYNNLSSKGVLLTPKRKKENASVKKKEKKEDKLSQKDSENKKIDGNKKKKRKKSKNKNEEKILTENFENSKKDNIINIGEDYKEIEISETVLSEIVLIEKLKTIPKERKKKMKGRNNINIVIIGLNEVGKSSFCIRFVDNKFEDFYIPSIGIENYSKIIAYNLRNYKLNFSVIWGDIKKHENLLSEADFFFLIYDITKIRSFNQINIYLKQLQKYLFLYDKEGKSPNFCLIGNKCDMEGERRVESEVVNKCIDKYKIKHFDISVKTANNMNNLIQFFVNIFDKIAFSNK
jgi:GTPase SAR1 family protein